LTKADLPRPAFGDKRQDVGLVIAPGFVETLQLRVAPDKPLVASLGQATDVDDSRRSGLRMSDRGGVGQDGRRKTRSRRSRPHRDFVRNLGNLVRGGIHVLLAAGRRESGKWLPVARPKIEASQSSEAGVGRRLKNQRIDAKIIARRQAFAGDPNFFVDDVIGAH
jgi:hypothetical protein